MPTSESNPGPAARPAAPESGFDAVIAVYKRDVDRTLLRDNLRLTPEERIRKLQRFLELSEHLREAGRKLP